MGFSQMMTLLQKKNSGKIVVCNMGNFYVAIGRDAVLLNYLLKLKVTCFKEEMCKVGFPICSLEKYTDAIQEKGYSYIVYYFNQQKEELEILKEYNGQKTNEIHNDNMNCYICSNSIEKYKKTDKYIVALSKLYEKEEQESCKCYITKDVQDNKKSNSKLDNNKNYKQEVKRKRKIWFQKKNRQIN